jgi:hypothetical protein
VQLQVWVLALEVEAGQYSVEAEELGGLALIQVLGFFVAEVGVRELDELVLLMVTEHFVAIGRLGELVLVGVPGYFVEEVGGVVP